VVEEHRGAHTGVSQGRFQRRCKLNQTKQTMAGSDLIIQDIRIAKEYGVAGCILSNHGGRQLDRCVDPACCPLNDYADHVAPDRALIA
jgi:hypothetical protein